MGRRTVSVAALLVLLAAGCGWGQWAGGPEHRGSATFTGGSPTAVTGWVAHQVSPVATGAPVVTANGLVFHVTAGRLRALDPGSGAVVWAADLPAGTVAGSAPAVHGVGATATVFVEVAAPGGTALIGFDVGGVRNCDPVTLTCRPLFSASVATGAAPPAPVLVSGDRVFTAGVGTLVAFDARGTTNCSSFVGTSICTPLWSANVGTTTAGVGPTGTADVVYAAGTAAGVATVRALDAATGAERWRGSLGAAASATPSIGLDGRVYVPAGTAIRVFAGGGCGTSTCAPASSLIKRVSDPVAAYRSTPVFAGSKVYATVASGQLSSWPTSGCASPCAASDSALVNAPTGGSNAYNRTPVVADGVVYVLALRSVGLADHVMLVASDAATLDELRTWDLGPSGFGLGLGDVSLADGVVYAPVGDGLDAVGPPVVHPLAALTVGPLAMSPAFDPTITDYAMRCAAGTNTVSVAMRAVTGGTVRLVGPIVTSPVASQTRNVAVAVDQAVVVEAADAQGRTAQYWIRCLPPDFPKITATPHPAVGTPTPGWYVMGNAVTPTDVARFAMILDAHGTPVWYKRAVVNVQNVTPVARGQVAFLPTVTVAFGSDPNGHYDVYDVGSRTGLPVSTLRPVGVPADLHELQTLPNGDHLMLSYPLKRGVDLTGLPGVPDAGPNSTIADCVVQDIDPHGNLVWQWTGSDHLDPITETTAPLVTSIGTETVYDVFHCNSIDPNPNGNVLVSARHLNAVFEVRRSDGKILWKLGGTPVNHDGAAILAIRNDPDNGPVQQHDARYLSNGHISLYDNRTSPSARAVEYAVDVGARTASAVFSYVQPGAQASCCMGSFRTYPDGHRVIGWGYVVFDPLAMTELDAAGNDVLDLTFQPGTASYRAVKVPPTFYDLGAMRLSAGT